jgi:amino-acid N-acetyltransferase
MRNLVEKAQLSDAKAIQNLIKSDPEHLLPRSLANIKEFIHSFYIIRDGEKVVACAAFENYSKRIAEIRSMFVLPEYRSRGYGKLLVKTLMKLAPKTQEVFVVTSSTKFFTALGFQPALKEREILFLRNK